jgi:hypothetical protein
MEKSDLPPNWNTGFIGTPLEEISKKYHNLNYKNAGNFQKECIEKLKIIYGTNEVNKIQTSLKFIAYSDWSFETFCWQIVYYISNIVTHFKKIEEQTSEYMNLIYELQKYGLHRGVNKSNYENYSMRYTIDKLRGELREYQSAEVDAQNILNDKYVMDQLIRDPSITGWIVNRINPENVYSVNVTVAAKKLLQPKIDEFILQHKTDL